MSVAAVMLREGMHYAVEDRGHSTPCWIWRGGTSAGRPVAYAGPGKQRNAYRLAWEQKHGVALDVGTIVKRICLVTLCINPDHCEPSLRKLGRPRRRPSWEERRNGHLRRYGITVGDYERLLAEQGGVCAVCKRENRDRLGRRLHVDHCHETGRVRGLLCSNCNNAIGQAGESAERLLALADYLQERSERSPLQP